MQQHMSHQFRDRLRTQDPDVQNSLRLSGDLCDVTLVVADQEFRAHKVILVGSSPYFKAMFSTKFDEKDQSKVQIKEIIPKYFEMILEFIYTGKRMEITVENVQSLLETASKLIIDPAIDMCSQFLAERLDISNCLDILNFAVNTGCHNLKKKAEEFAGKNFNKIVNSLEFPLFSLENVVSLLSLDTLDVPEETIVTQVVMPWVNHNPGSRSSSLVKLLPHVRFPHLSPDFIEDTVKPLLKENHCKEYLDRIDAYLALDSAQKCSHDLHNEQPRESQNKVILGLGQLREDAISSNNNTHHIFQFDPKVGKWIFPENMKYPLIWDCLKTSDWVDAIVEMDKVFMFYDNHVVVLEPRSGRWEHHILPYDRIEERKTVLDGKIYIVGGNNDYGDENSVQILVIDLDNNSIEALASMSCAREAPGVIAHDGKIFVFGGCSSGPNPSVLSSCEVYHVKENRWETIADMPTRRKYFSVTELHGKIYVIGGHYEADNVWNNNSYVVECYDPEKNIWESLPDMELEKYGEAPAIGFNGKLFVGGGEREFDEDNKDSEDNRPYASELIETFDLRTNQWNLEDKDEIPLKVEDEGPYVKNMFVIHKKFLSEDL